MSRAVKVTGGLLLASDGADALWEQLTRARSLRRAILPDGSRNL